MIPGYSGHEMWGLIVKLQEGNWEAVQCQLILSVDEYRGKHMRKVLWKLNREVEMLGHVLITHQMAICLLPKAEAYPQWSFGTGSPGEWPWRVYLQQGHGLLGSARMAMLRSQWGDCFGGRVPTMSDACLSLLVIVWVHSGAYWLLSFTSYCGSP